MVMRFHLARLLAFLALMVLLALAVASVQFGPGGPGLLHRILLVVAIVPAATALVRAGGAVLAPDAEDTWRRLGWAAVFFAVSVVILVIAGIVSA
jgi:hypothetical protein